MLTKLATRSGFLAGVCAGLLLVLLAPAGAKAQVNTGTVLGTVTDASGAVVAGAKISVRNTGTGVMRTALSDAQGRYSVPDLPIGSYDVQAENTGFQTVIRKAVNLTVGAQIVVDFALPVGGAQQTITVESQVTQVEVTSTAVGNLVEPTQMTQLPLNGRNFEQLLTLEPGVTATQNGNSFYGTQNNYSIAGSRPEGQQFLLDGSDIQTFWAHGTGSGASGESLGIDAIVEFQTLTDTYSAQFGGNGAVVNATTKSGTNSFHGSAYEFFRNSALDARNYFDPATIPELRRNQFGGSLGGPVKKDKAFFFVNYEGLRWALGSTQIANVPDAAAHQGLLPDCVVNSAPACTVGQLDNVGVAANTASTLALYPTPPAANEILAPIGPNGALSPTGSATIQQVANQPTSENYVLGRFDYTFSDKDSLFLRAVRDTASQILPFSGSQIPLWPEQDSTANYFSTIEERHLFSANLINLARFDFNRPNDGGHPITNTTPLQFFPGREDGQVILGNLTTIGVAPVIPFTLPEDKFTFADNVIWTRGGHSLAFGMSVERVDSNTFAPFLYGTQWTFASLQSFLQGNAAFVIGAVPGQADANKDFRELFLEPYFNDTWKLNPKVTLNYGFRYDYQTNPLEVNHPIEALVNPPFGNFVPVSHAFRTNPSAHNFEPRIGVAYDPFGDHKTSIRAGFGIFDDMVLPRLYDPGYWLNPPFTIGFEAGPQYPTAFPANCATCPPSQISQAQGIDYNFGSTPYMIQYNLNIQRELGQGTVLTIGYVGSQGAHLVLDMDVNPPGQVVNGKIVPWINNGSVPGLNDPTNCEPGAAPPPDGQPIFGCLAPGGVGVNALPRANPTYASLDEKIPGAHSHYNSLQVSLNHEFSHNFQAQVSYTYSKSLDNSSVTYGLETFSNGPMDVQNPFDPAADHGRSIFDQTHGFRASGVFEVPFHRNEFVRGWQLAGILTANSGFPLPMLDAATDYTGTQLTSGRPDLKSGFSQAPKILGKPNQWWDPSGFVLPPVGEVGNVGRDTALGPDLVNLDFSIIKDTAIRKVSEAFHAQFRAEFFNILNHPNFGNPNPNVFVSTGPNSFGVNPVFGQVILTSTTSRQIQLALKLLF